MSAILKKTKLKNFARCLQIIMSIHFFISYIIVHYKKWFHLFLSKFLLGLMVGPGLYNSEKESSMTFEIDYAKICRVI